MVSGDSYSRVPCSTPLSQHHHAYASVVNNHADATALNVSRVIK